MKVEELMQQARDTITVKRVYGEPYEKDGTTVIPAAHVWGGFGGGGGTDSNSGAEGAGGGYGVRATPAGAYVIKDGRVAWQPAVDVNRIIAGAFALAAVAVIAGTLRRRR